MSTTEAEFVALSEVTKEVMWMNIFLTELRFKVDQPFRIFEDNGACIDIAKEPRHPAKAKHINMSIHFVRELMAAKVIKLC
jgi:hypothetical protein